jgi:RNA polymerase sigma factor (sigma-70 family)
MSAWNRLRDSFRSHLTTAAARRDFATLRERHDLLRRFDGADAAIRALSAETDDPTAYAEKDDLYRHLIREARGGASTAATASAILWLGSWLALDRVYRQYAPDFCDPDDAAGELVGHVTTAIMTMNLDRVRFVAPMVTRVAMEETLRAAKRARRREPGEVSEANDDNPIVTEESELAWRERDPDARVEIDRLLADASPRDRELLVRRFVQGETYDEIGRALGIASGAAQRAVSRALERVRARV